METSSSFYKIIFLTFLSQVGLMILLNWVNKIIFLLKENSFKFFAIVFGVSTFYFGYTVFFTELNFVDSAYHSIFWIPLIVFSIIDFCIQ